jgi:hypothetical protein
MMEKFYILRDKARANLKLENLFFFFLLFGFCFVVGLFFYIFVMPKFFLIPKNMGIIYK